VSDANGCTATTAVTVQAYSSPTLSLIAPKNEICIGESLNLTATSNAPLRWSNNATTQQITVAPVITTTYIVTATSVNGCTATDLVTITVNPLPIPNIDETEGTQCLGTTAILVASGGVAYTWTGGQIRDTLSTTTAGAYTVTVTDVKGCKNTKSATVVINHATASITIPKPEICFGDNITLTASGAGTGDYEWSNSDATATTVVSPIVTTVYTVMVTDANECKATTEQIVIVNPLPIATVAPNAIALCNDITDSAIAIAQGGGTNGLYEWNFGGINTAEATFLLAGTYTVTVTTAKGCVSTTSIVVTPPINISGAVRYTATIDAANPLSVHFVCNTPAVPNASYLWSPGETLTFTTPYSLDYTYSVAALYISSLEVRNPSCTKDSDVWNSIIDLINGTTTLPAPFTNAYYTTAGSMQVLTSAVLPNQNTMLVVRLTGNNVLRESGTNVSIA
jgi:hypothetical protein